MARLYPHRYRVLSGTHAGEVHDGIEIGLQDYPDQFKSMTPEQVQAHIHAQTSKEGIWSKYLLKEGIWLTGPGVRVARNDHCNTTITNEGVSYGTDYIDLCVPFDRYGNEIAVGDTLMIASKNEVRRVQVVKIAVKPFMANYGIMNRKLTVYDSEEDQTLTINDPRATVKV